MTYRVVRVERSIPAPSTHVWAVFADLANHASWRGDVKALRMLGGATSGVGARRHLDFAPVGGVDETILDWEEGSRMVVAVDNATVLPVKSGEATFVVDREGDDRSTVTMEFRYIPKGGPFGRVIGAVADRQLTKAFRGVFADLEHAARKRDRTVSSDRIPRSAWATRTEASGTSPQDHDATSRAERGPAR